MLIKIINQSLWRDEAVSALLSQKFPQEILRLLSGDVNPPLYYVFLHYWTNLWGSSELALRSFSLLSLVLLSLVIFFLTKSIWKNRTVAGMAALVTLFNPLLLVLSFEATIFSFFALLVSLAAFGAVSGWVWLVILATTLAIYTHHFGWFVFGGVLFYYALQLKNDRKWLRFLVILFTPLLFSLPALALITKQIGRVASEGFWLGPVESKSFVELYRIFAYGPFEFKAQAMLYNLTAILTTFAASVWILKSMVFKEEKQKIFIVSALCFLPIILAYVVSFYKPIFYYRYLVISLPLLIALLVGSLYRLYGIVGETMKKAMLILATAYVVFLLQGAQEILEKQHTPPIREAVMDVTTQIATGDMVVAESILNYLETKYYLQVLGKTDLPLRVLEPSGKVVYYVGAILFDKDAPIAELPKDKRVWLIKRDGSKELVTPPIKSADNSKPLE